MFKTLSVIKSALVDIELEDSTTIQLTNWYKNDGNYNVDTFSFSDITNSLGVNVPSFEIFNITDSTIRSKSEDGFMIKAQVTVTLKDQGTDETYVLFKGQVQRVNIADYWVDLDCQGFMALTEQDLNWRNTKECLNDLGDENCGVNLAGFTDSGSVTTVVSRSEFIDTSLSQADNWYQYGKVTFTSGANNGLSREVFSYDSSTDTVKLFIPFPYDMAVTDTYDIYRGCQKDQSDCTDVFSNWPNFRGYVFFNVTDEDLRYDPDDDEDEIDDEDDDNDDQEI